MRPAAVLPAVSMGVDAKEFQPRLVVTRLAWNVPAAVGVLLGYKRIIPLDVVNPGFRRARADSTPIFLEEVTDP